MRISILSGDTYVYSEIIARKQIAESSKTKGSEASSASKATENSEEFDTILKDIQKKLAVLSEGSVNNIGNASANAAARISNSSVGDAKATPMVNTSSSDKNINVNKTEDGYVSIAPDNLRPIFERAAKEYGLDQKLLELIGYHESAFQLSATSKHGAMGIMQLMPETAHDMGVSDAYDPEQNIMGASKLLRMLADEYNGNLDLILSGYSAGMNAVEKYNGVPPYEQTTSYIAWIRERYP